MNWNFIEPDSPTRTKISTKRGKLPRTEIGTQEPTVVAMSKNRWYRERPHHYSGYLIATTRTGNWKHQNYHSYYTWRHYYKALNRWLIYVKINITNTKSTYMHQSLKENVFKKYAVNSCLGLAWHNLIWLNKQINLTETK